MIIRLFEDFNEMALNATVRGEETKLYKVWKWLLNNEHSTSSELFKEFPELTYNLLKNGVQEGALVKLGKYYDAVVDYKFRGDSQSVNNSDISLKNKSSSNRDSSSSKSNDLSNKLVKDGKFTVSFKSGGDDTIHPSFVLNLKSSFKTIKDALIAVLEYINNNLDVLYHRESRPSMFGIPSSEFYDIVAFVDRKPIITVPHEILSSRYPSCFVPVIIIEIKGDEGLILVVEPGIGFSVYKSGYDIKAGFVRYEDNGGWDCYVDKERSTISLSSSEHQELLNIVKRCVPYTSDTKSSLPVDAKSKNINIYDYI